MNTKNILPLKCTNVALDKIKNFIKEKNNLLLKLRIYIIGGGCNGFQYGFIFDDKINDDDFIFQENGIFLIVDAMSYQYLMGSIIDYSEKLSGSHFIIINPNAKITCSCGSSFSI